MLIRKLSTRYLRYNKTVLSQKRDLLDLLDFLDFFDSLDYLDFGLMTSF